MGVWRVRVDTSVEARIFSDFNIVVVHNTYIVEKEMR